jgi:hypothetical protein
MGPWGAPVQNPARPFRFKPFPLEFPMRLTVSAAALMIAASPVWAQVTADQVWDQIVAAYGRVGVDLTATVTRDGSAVVLTDIAGTWPLPMGFGALTMTVGDVTMAEAADGTVTAAFPPESRMEMILDWQDGVDAGQVVAAVDITTVNQQTIISGAPGDMIFATTADSYSANFADLSETGSTAFGDVDLPLVYVLVEGVSNTTHITGTDMMTIAVTGVGARVVTDVGFAADDFSNKGVTEARDIVTELTLILPPGELDLLNLSGALRQGMLLSATASNGPSRSQSVTMIGTEVIQDQSASIGAANQTLTIDQSGISVFGTISDYQVTVLMPGMPDNFSLQMEEVTSGLTFPLLATGAAQDASLSLSVRGVDPGPVLDLVFGTMAADFGGNADLTLQIDAQVTPRQDLLNIIPLVEDLDSGKVAIEFNRIAVPVAQLSWEGAEADASGEMLLQFGGINSYDALPDPTLSAEYRLKGVGALIGRLADAGLLPQEQVFVIQGGLAMIGLPVGEDEYQGSFSVDANGVATLNGNPMPF